MRLYPEETETFVMLHDHELVSARLEALIGKQVMSSGVPRLIDGWVKDGRFQLTLRTRRQQFFVPLLNGQIESSSKGSLVFIRYALFPATKMLLSFWSVVLPLLSVVIYAGYKNLSAALALLLFTLLIHLVARSNFRYHTRIAKQLLRDLLS